jgi:hypothetical protein
MSEEFTGMSSEMRNSQWLASEDLEDRGGSAVATIASCKKHKNVEFEAGRKEKIVYTLRFVKKEKELVLNATNRKMLKGLFGSDVSKWKGQKIELYVQGGIKLMGKTVNGIRIREIQGEEIEGTKDES